MNDLDIELTPRAIAEIQRWILLLAADDHAPSWDPVEPYLTPDALRAAAEWLADHGHSRGLDRDLVGVLLAVFSVSVRAEMDAVLQPRFIPRDAA
jgi:hypothetical protein